MSLRKLSRRERQVRRNARRRQRYANCELRRDRNCVSVGTCAWSSIVWWREVVQACNIGAAYLICALSLCCAVSVPRSP
jgi:hypothetical protein